MIISNHIKVLLEFLSGAAVNGATYVSQCLLGQRPSLMMNAWMFSQQILEVQGTTIKRLGKNPSLIHQKKGLA